MDKHEDGSSSAIAIRGQLDFTGMEVIMCRLMRTSSTGLHGLFKYVPTTPVSGNKAAENEDFLAGAYLRRRFLDFPSTQCDPRLSQDRDEGFGYVRHIFVQGKEFMTTKGKEDNIVVQFKTTYTIIKETAIASVDAMGSASAPGDENAIRIS